MPEARMQGAFESGREVAMAIRSRASDAELNRYV
jgi:hypothetical protein